MQLFYNKEIDTASSHISFSKEESRHIVKVLRKANGDILQITDGKGKLFSAKIIQVSDKKCTAEILNWEQRPTTRDYHLHIAIAPTKLNDRFEWFLEKATEIGIDEITPVFCDHSERRQVKMERIEKVVLSAMKQSLKFYLPVVNEPVKFKDFIQKKDWDLGLIAHCADGSKQHPRDFFPYHQKLMIFIGPEGDFSTQEIKIAEEKGLKSITFGESRLRTETAGIVACHTVSLLNEIL